LNFRRGWIQQAGSGFFVDPADDIVFMTEGQSVPPRYRQVLVPVVHALVHAAIIE
jgi:hypothetical protein